MAGLPYQLARRGYQDYTSWANYLYRSQWDDIDATPLAAGEIITAQMHALLLKNPSEQTSATIAAGIAVATYGHHVDRLSSRDMNTILNLSHVQGPITISASTTHATLAVTTAAGSPHSY
jgi:hypothetical protein